LFFFNVLTSIFASLKEMSQQPHRFLPLFILLALSLIWGSSFILMKRGLEVFSSVQVGAFRLVIAAMALSPVVIANFGPAIRKKLRYFAVVGLVGNGIPAFLFAAAQTRITSSTAGALNALTPLFTLLLGVWLFHMPFNRSKLWGVIIGLLGAMVLILLRGNGLFDPNWAWGLLVVLATLMYGTSVNTVSRFMRDVKPVVTAAVPLVLAGIPAVFILFSTDFIDRLALPGALEAVGYLSILGLVGSAASLVAFNKLIQMSGPIFASTTTYLMPIVALFWGFLDGELLGWPHVLGMLAILIGIWLVNRKRS
jgi:drug/metabolite transporter (DMT)-like permease